jgi:hypothetical protein
MFLQTFIVQGNNAKLELRSNVYAYMYRCTLFNTAFACTQPHHVKPEYVKLASSVLVFLFLVIVGTLVFFWFSDVSFA